MMSMKISKTITRKRKKKVLLMFDDIIDMEAYEKSSPAVTELFLRGRKLNI